MKLLFVKRSFFIALACIIALGAGTGVCVGVAASSLTSEATNMPVIVIDPGHGGVDAGVLGINTKTKESNINLAISKYLKGYFTDAGFNCIMTRTTQGGLYGTATSGFKMRDMTKRKQIIQDNNADMVISVHQNYCPLPSRRGGIVFYDADSDCGRELAYSIQNELNQMETCVRTSTPLTGDYYMLKCTDSPSVIVECGFLSNAEDEKLLIDESYQKAVAYAIFKGAVGYYS